MSLTMARTLLKHATETSSVQKLSISVICKCKANNYVVPFPSNDKRSGYSQRAASNGRPDNIKEHTRTPSNRSSFYWLFQLLLSVTVWCNLCVDFSEIVTGFVSHENTIFNWKSFTVSIIFYVSLQLHLNAQRSQEVFKFQTKNLNKNKYCLDDSLLLLSIFIKCIAGIWRTEIK